MNAITRGMRNAFRNSTRASAIIIILGLSMGLSITMLVAHQAVQNKIKVTLASIGNTVDISPAGVVAGSSVNNALTTAQLDTVR